MDDKHKRMPIKRKLLAAFAAVLLVLLVASVTLSADSGSYDLSWWTVDGGGGTSSSGNYTLIGTIGQSDAGTSAMSGGTYSLSGGFWGIAGSSSSGGYKIYLPLVLK